MLFDTTKMHGLYAEVKLKSYLHMEKIASIHVSHSKILLLSLHYVMHKYDFNMAVICVA